MEASSDELAASISRSVLYLSHLETKKVIQQLISFHLTELVSTIHPANSDTSRTSTFQSVLTLPSAQT